MILAKKLATRCETPYLILFLDQPQLAHGTQQPVGTVLLQLAQIRDPCRGPRQCIGHSQLD